MHSTKYILKNVLLRAQMNFVENVLSNNTTDDTSTGSSNTESVTEYIDSNLNKDNYEVQYCLCDSIIDDSKNELELSGNSHNKIG
jgi:hypothetical protein